MPKKVTTKYGRIEVPMDVRSEKDIGAFENLLHIGPLTIVLVYADWCGHCTTFKNNVWNKVDKTPNKTVNTASVHYDMLDKTSLANSKIEGYPSLLLIGTDKKPADFKDDMGKKTNAMPTPQTVTEMKRIIETPLPAPVKNANSVAKTIMTNAKNTSAVAPVAAVPEVEEVSVAEEVNTSATNITKAENITEVKNINAKNIKQEEPEEDISTIEKTVNIVNSASVKPSNAVNTTPTVSKNTYTPAPANTLLAPPDTLTDLVETQKTEPAQLGGGRTTHRGGNLMSTLLEITGEIAPAGILLAAASVSASRVRSSYKKSSKKTRRVSRRKNNSTYRKRR